ncbi:uncharacterized protein [Lolium perenne]|uniref:uncharacterized protein isoform X3 n=1 Tax=Lolium perenne TaxID=4522 RepID=UPI0021F5BA8D|nr:uncharacterized protein LOC127322798 isoform X3 [Lolium perenne]XP_051214907.1 uncharacterized protein LOC127332628 isoform X3 [Lolium perenne]
MYVAHEFGITRIFAFKSTSVTCWGVNIPIPEMDILLESLRIIMWQCPGSTKKEPIETTLYALAIEPIETLVGATTETENRGQRGTAFQSR